MQRFSAILEEFWIAIFAWIPTPLGIILRLIAWRWLFKACGSVRFGCSLFIAGSKNITIGNGVRIGKGSFLTANNGRLDLSDYVAVAPNVNIGADDGVIKIGKYTAIGPGTVIRAANHRFDRLDMPISLQGHVPGSVIIEDNIWIGANCVITPDVRIGEGAIVGAGSVVTKDVEAFSIVGGVPSHLIGYRNKQEEK